jgi:UDP-glucose:glycoprotein glucosyltransferase
MRPIYPGQLHTLQKNIHHVVFALDLSKKEDLTRLLEEVVTLIKRQIPIRFGIVALAPENNENAATITKTFYHLIHAYGRAIAVQFVENLLENYDETSLLKKAKSLYSTIYSKAPVVPDFQKASYDEVIAGTDVIVNTRAWARRLGVNPKEGAIFGNGQVFVKDDTWISKVGQALNEDVQILQGAVYGAEISDDDDILEFLFKDSPKTRNEYIFPVQAGSVRFLNLVATLPKEGGIVYLHGESDGPGNASVIWVIDDFDSFNGLDLVRHATAFQDANPGTTIALVHNPGPATGPQTLSSLLYYLATNGLLEGDGAKQVFQQLLHEIDNTNGVASGIDSILGVKTQSWSTVDTVLAEKFWGKGHAFAQSAGFKGGERGLVINGRVLTKRNAGIKGRLLGLSSKAMLSKRMISKRCPSMKELRGFSLLSMRPLNLVLCRVKRSMESVRCCPSNIRSLTLILAQLTSIASVSSTSDVPPGIFDTPVYSRRRSYELLNPTIGVLEYGSLDDAVFQFAITLDPLSEAAQKWSSIIKVRQPRDHVLTFRF